MLGTVGHNAERLSLPTDEMPHSGSLLIRGYQGAGNGPVESVISRQKIQIIGLNQKTYCTIMKLLLQAMGSFISPIVREEVITIGRKESFNNPAVAKRTYTVAEIMEILGVSRKKAYELCNSDCFKIVRVGRSIRVSKSSFDAWLDSQTSDMEE